MVKAIHPKTGDSLARNRRAVRSLSMTKRCKKALQQEAVECGANASILSRPFSIVASRQSGTANAPRGQAYLLFGGNGDTFFLVFLAVTLTIRWRHSISQPLQAATVFQVTVIGPPTGAATTTIGVAPTILVYRTRQSLSMFEETVLP